MNAKYILTKSVQISIIVFLSIKLYGCANKTSGPQGGPKDEDPPVVKKESPLNGSVNYKTKEVEVVFDEIIQLDKVMENVLVSPPQKTPAEISSYGKKLHVKFEDDLVDSTTYTISFGDAIVDNNEKNVLKGYNFSFSTGDILDSLEISGTLINAEDLNPADGKTVGIYAELDDSIFSKKSFLRITKTDENGNFSVKNVRSGSYRIFALNDMNRDYMLQPGEGLASYDSIITPYSRIEQMTDTVWADSLTVDSVRTYMGTQFYPNDVVMHYFEENKKRLYFVKADRPEPHYFKLYFSTEQKTPPTLSALNDVWNENALVQMVPTNDTITYWIKDSTVIKTDTLLFAMNYFKTDSLYNLQAQTDTIKAIYRAKITNKKKKKDKNKKEVTNFLKFNCNATGTFEIYNPLLLTMESPQLTVDTSKIHLSEIIDTIVSPLPLSFQPMDSIGMRYAINHDWKAEKKYEITIDSLAFVDIYGLHNDKFNSKFTIRSLDEYSKLIIKLVNFDARAVIQILDKEDKVVRSLPAQEEGTVFEYLSPQEYYMRLFVDENGDGKWTSGDFAKKQKPEQVYYFPNKLELRANWDFEENWNFTEKPLMEQKPTEIRKKLSEKKKK